MVVKLGGLADAVQQMKIADPGPRKGDKGGDARAGGNEHGRIAAGLVEKKAESRAQVKHPTHGHTGQQRRDFPLRNVSDADCQVVIMRGVNQRIGPMCRTGHQLYLLAGKEIESGRPREANFKGLVREPCPAGYRHGVQRPFIR